MRSPPLKNFHRQVVELLGAQIVTGAIPEGARLPTEPQLAERFGASRLVIREAMKSLAAKGLVTIRPRIGTRVLSRTHWSLFDADVLSWYSGAAVNRKLISDLMELRGAIEPLAAKLAAQRGSDEDIGALRAAYEAMSRADSRASYLAADLAFHGAVIRACDNVFIRRLEGALSEVLSASFKASSDDWGPDARALRLHEALVDAIEARDSPAAEAAVQALIERASERIAGRSGSPPGGG